MSSWKSHWRDHYQLTQKVLEKILWMVQLAQRQQNIYKVYSFKPSRKLQAIIQIVTQYLFTSLTRGIKSCKLGSWLSLVHTLTFQALSSPRPCPGSFVGSPVCRKPLDPHREVLMCAKLPFDSWRVSHDKIKSEIRAIGYDAGVNVVDPEPYGLFSAHIPAAAAADNGLLQHLRESQGLMLDLLIKFPNSVGNT